MEINSIQDICELVKSGETNWKQYGHVSTQTIDDLTLFNYSPMAQIEGRWNFFELVSRGLIINRNGEVIARPFDKFFNWTEGGRVARGHIVTITEKMDGSLGVLYRNRGVPQIATRGSMVSEQAMWASLQLLNHNPSEIPDELTLLFEIIYPDNRIVINYGQRESLVLLAARNRHTGEYLPFFPDVYELAQKHGFETPQVFTFDGLTAVIESCGAIDANHEGYVIEFSDGQRFKFKGDRYRELHKLISGLTFKNTLRAMANNTVADFIGIIPDEFLDEVRGWIAEIEAIRDEMKSQAVEAFNAAPKTSRKDFALWVQSMIVKDRQPYMYALLDGKPIEPIIYRKIEDMPDRAVVSGEIDS